MGNVRVGSECRFRPNPSAWALQVVHVQPGGPADSAGVREGELLVAMLGAQLHTPDDLSVHPSIHPSYG